MRLKAVHVTMFLLFVVGVLLIATSCLLSKSPVADFIRDLGMVIGPIGLVGLLYEILLRRGFLRAIQDIFPGFSVNQTLDLRERQLPEIYKMLAEAKNEILLMGGNLSFMTYLTERLADIFRKTKTVRILIMNGHHEAARMREKQITTDGSWNYAALFEQTVRALRDISRKLGDAPATVDIRAYDMPAMHFLCIVDRHKMVLNNYSYGRTGIASPHLYLDHCDTDAISNGMMKRYIESFEYVWSMAKPIKIENSETHNRVRGSD